MVTKARRGHLGKIAIESAVSGSGKLDDFLEEIETAADDCQAIKARREQKQRNRRIFRAWAREGEGKRGVCEVGTVDGRQPGCKHRPF